MCALASRGRRANPVLTYETVLRRFFAWQSALFMGKWRASGTQLRGRCAESRHAVASLRVPGYVRVSSLRDEMRLSGCLYNRSSAVDVRVLTSRGRQANPVLTYETALRRFSSASLAKPLPKQKKLPDSLIAAAQCTNYSLVLSWHFKLKDKQIETL